MVGSVPSEADWRSEPWDLDIPYAYKHFAGKSFDDAVKLFEENSLRYQEDVMFMPRACFPFYARAYMAYLKSDSSKEDSDGAGCFFGLAEVRAEEIKSDPSLLSDFAHCLDHLAERQDFYKADVDIYGSFADRTARTKRILTTSPTGD